MGGECSTCASKGVCLFFIACLWCVYLFICNIIKKKENKLNINDILNLFSFLILYLLNHFCMWFNNKSLVYLQYIYIGSMIQHGHQDKWKLLIILGILCNKIVPCQDSWRPCFCFKLICQCRLFYLETIKATAVMSGCRTAGHCDECMVLGTSACQWDMGLTKG